jgi:hypothetical protein
VELGEIPAREKFARGTRGRALEKFHERGWSACALAVVVRAARGGTRIARDFSEIVCARNWRGRCGLTTKPCAKTVPH